MSFYYCMLKHLLTLFQKKSVPVKTYPIDTDKIEKHLQYVFRDKSLLVRACTHRSYLAVNKAENWNSNERLEFLGDAVLNLLITEYLFKNKPKKDEGVLSRYKSILVSRKVLSIISREHNFGEFLLVNFGEEKTGGRDRASNLGNLYESLVGAIYLDGGLKNAGDFINRTLLFRAEELLNQKTFYNYKSILLEHAQSIGLGNPRYNLVSESGPDHQKHFVINVTLDGSKFFKGEGKSKKNAEQQAAYHFLKNIAPELIVNNYE